MNSNGTANSFATCSIRPCGLIYLYALMKFTLHFLCSLQLPCHLPQSPHFFFFILISNGLNIDTLTVLLSMCHGVDTLLSSPLSSVLLSETPRLPIPSIHLSFFMLYTCPQPSPTSQLV